jgi:hypothetical protein
MSLPYIAYAALILLALAFVGMALNYEAVTVSYALDLGDLLTSVLALSGILTLFLTLQQIGEGSKATRAQFVLELNREFMSREMRAFYYRLDYKSDDSFKFDPLQFPRSEDEHQLDLMLYRFSFVGQLLKERVLRRDDLIWIKTMAKRSIGHPEVAKYLAWLQTEVPGHTGFRNAIYLYQHLCGIEGSSWPLLQSYLGPMGSEKSAQGD